MTEISGHDICKSVDCIRCEIREADGKDRLCSICRMMVKRGIMIFPRPFRRNSGSSHHGSPQRGFSPHDSVLNDSSYFDLPAIIKRLTDQ